MAYTCAKSAADTKLNNFKYTLLIYEKYDTMHSNVDYPSSFLPGKAGFAIQITFHPSPLPKKYPLQISVKKGPNEK